MQIISCGIFGGGSDFDWVFELEFYAKRFWYFPFWRFLWELFFFIFSDSQQCVKNVNHQPKVKRTLKTSNSKVIASSLLLVLVLSAICDVTGESSRSKLSNWLKPHNELDIYQPQKYKKSSTKRIIDTTNKQKKVPHKKCVWLLSGNFLLQVKIRAAEKISPVNEL